MDFVIKGECSYKTSVVPLYKRTVQSPVPAGDFTLATIAGEHKPQSLAEAQSSLQLYSPRGRQEALGAEPPWEERFHWPRGQYKFSLEMLSPSWRVRAEGGSPEDSKVRFLLSPSQWAALHPAGPLLGLIFGW